jgi:hypothetical protein
MLYPSSYATYFILAGLYCVKKLGNEYVMLVTPFLKSEHYSKCEQWVRAQSTHRVATAAFWHSFNHDGKISPRW